MSVKIKDNVSTDSESISTVPAAANFPESIVSLYQYSGFALHSMLDNRKALVKKMQYPNQT